MSNLYATLPDIKQDIKKYINQFVDGNRNAVSIETEYTFYQTISFEDRRKNTIPNKGFEALDYILKTYPKSYTVYDVEVYRITIPKVATIRKKIYKNNINSSDIRIQYDVKVRHNIEDIESENISKKISTEYSLSESQYNKLIQQYSRYKPEFEAYTRTIVNINKFISICADSGPLRRKYYTGNLNRCEIDITVPLDAKYREDFENEIGSLVVTINQMQSEPLTNIINKVIFDKDEERMNRSAFPHPKNMTLKYLSYGGIVAHPNTGYTVTFKVDGQHVFAVFKDGNAYYIDYNGSVKYIQSNVVKVDNGLTILEGELTDSIVAKDIKYFIPFDAIMYQDENITDYDFSTRMKYCRRFSTQLTTSGVIYKDKTFNDFNYLDVYDTLTNICNIYEKQLSGQFSADYKIDGLIFIPTELNYLMQLPDVPKTTISYENIEIEPLTPKILKWKPLDLLTIDFRYKNNDLFASAKLPTGRFGDVSIFSYQEFKDFRINRNNIDVVDNQIVECQLYGNEFIFQRVRLDKLHPNKDSDAIKMYYLHQNPITFDILKGQSNVLLRKHHNQIKNQLFEKDVSNEKILLDLGTGRGGDLSKYYKDNSVYSKIYAVEPNKDNYNELIKRLNNFDKLKDIVIPINCGAEDVQTIKSAMGKDKADTIAMMLSLTFFDPKNEEQPTMQQLATTMLECSAEDFTFLVLTMERDNYYENKDKLRYNMAKTTIKEIGNDKINIHIEDSIVTDQDEHLVSVKDLMNELNIDFNAQIIDVQNINKLLSKDEKIINDLYNAYIIDFDKNKKLSFKKKEMLRLPSRRGATIIDESTSEDTRSGSRSASPVRITKRDVSPQRRARTPTPPPRARTPTPPPRARTPSPVRPKLKSRIVEEVPVVEEVRKPKSTRKRRVVEEVPVVEEVRRPRTARKVVVQERVPSPPRARTPSPPRARTPSPPRARTPSPVRPKLKSTRRVVEETPVVEEVRKPRSARKRRTEEVVVEETRKPRTARKVVVQERVPSPPRARTPSPPRARTPTPPRRQPSPPKRRMEEVVEEVRKPKSTRKRRVVEEAPVVEEVRRPRTARKVVVQERVPSPPRARTPTPPRRQPSPPKRRMEEVVVAETVRRRRRPRVVETLVAEERVSRPQREVKAIVMDAVDFGVYEPIAKLYLDGQLIEDNVRIGLDSRHPLLHAIIYAASPDYHQSDNKERFIRDRVRDEKVIVDEAPINIVYAVMTGKDKAQIDIDKSINKLSDDSILIIEYDTPSGDKAYNLVSPPVDVDGVQLVSPIHLNEPVFRSLLTQLKKRTRQD